MQTGVSDSRSLWFMRYEEYQLIFTSLNLLTSSAVNCIISHCDSYGFEIVNTCVFVMCLCSCIVKVVDKILNLPLFTKICYLKHIQACI